MTASAWVRIVLTLALMGLVISGGGPALADSPAGVSGTAVPIYLDSSPAVENLAQRAGQLRQQGRLTEAAHVYQQLIEEHPPSLLTTAGGVSIDASDFARRQVAADADLLRAYRMVYGVVAQRALEEAAANGIDTEKLEAVLSVYALCPAGIEAGLQLAGLYLESAEFSEARSVLDQLEGLPELVHESSRWHWLQAAAALFSARSSDYQRHLAALGDPGDEAYVQQLETWAARLNSPLPPRALDALGELSVPIELPPVLWTRRLAELSSTPEDLTAGDQRPYRGQPPNGLFSPVLPVVCGQRVFLNTGQTITALDANCGRQIWRYQTQASPEDERVYGPYRAVGRSFSSLLVLGQYVVATTPNRAVPSWHPAASGSKTLVCLDADSGAVLWRLESGDVADKLDDTIFYDTPLGQGDRAFVLMRRGQQNGFDDLYLACVSVSSGRPLWWRHLSSAVQLGGELRQVAMTLVGSRLYVSDNLGIVACLNSRNGAMRWLSVLEGRPDMQRLDVAASHSRMSGRQPSPPLLTQAGLVIAPLLGQSVGYVLDPQTGAVVRTLRGGLWGSESYIQAAPDGVLLIGSTVQMLDSKTFVPRWTTTLSPHPNSDPVGRAAVTGDRLLVCLPTQLMTVNLSDGAILNRAPVSLPGNVVTVGEEVILCGLHAVRGHIVHERAFARIREAIERDPTDVLAGLSLAHAGLAADDPAVVLQGFDAALSALAAGRSAENRSPALPQPDLSPPVAEGAQGDENGQRVNPKQRVVFEELLAAAQEPRVAATDLRRELFDRLASATAGPADEVAYHLAIAEFLAQTSRPAQAVDHYQTILLESALTMQPSPHGYGSFQAQAEAQWQLARLIQQHGPTVYARYEALADAQLQLLLSDSAGTFDLGQDTPQSSPAALVELADQYPLSTVAAQALLIAAKLQHKQGGDDQAVVLLRQAYRKAQDSTTAGHVVGLLAALYQKNNMPHQAIAWLRRAARDYPDLQPIRRGSPVSIDRWISELSGDPRSGPRLPRLSLPLERPFAVAGQLLIPIQQPRDDWPRDAVVTHVGTAVQLRRGPRLEPVWTADLPAASPQLLAVTQEQVLLWLEGAGMLLALDAQTGQPMWPGLHLPAMAALRRNAVPARNGTTPPPGPVQVRQPWVSDVTTGNGHRFMLAVDEMTVAVADQKTGWAAGFDRYSGQLTWQFDTQLRPIRSVQAQHGLVAIAGLRAGRTTPGQRQGVILFLDAFTGQPRRPLIDEAQNITLLSIARPNLVLYTTQDRLVASDPNDGQVLWWTPLNDQMFPSLAAVNHETLLLVWGRFYSDIMAMDLTTGKINHILPGSVGLNNPLDLQSWFSPEGTGYILTPFQLTTIDPSGQLLWRDAIYNEDFEKRYLSGLVTEPAVIVLAIHGQSQPRQIVVNGRIIQLIRRNRPDAQDLVPPPTYSLTVMDRGGGRIIEEHILEDLPLPIDPSRAVAIDNALLFSTPTDTIVIPGAAPTGEHSPGADLNLHLPNPSNRQGTR